MRKLLVLFSLCAFTSIIFMGLKSYEEENNTEPNKTDTTPLPTPVFSSPKHEFRSAWITTFSNLDWPSKKGLSKEEQQKEIQLLFNGFKKSKINSVIVQVRAAGDAFYKSELAPWSEWLTGTQGQDPGYDPLQFMIRESHKRNLEFHAWLNPLRAVSHTRFSSVSDSNIVNQHPEWTFKYGDTKYFNPGIPEVRDYIVSIVDEIITNYDIDGIHFDDYFYPYEKKGETITDDSLFATYGAKFNSIEDWRRNNIDELIREISEAIKLKTPHVKFGVSPLAVWRNMRIDPLGSATHTSQTSFDNLYCNTKMWMKEGWIDYMVPQLYWSRDNEFANYNLLLDWWSTQEFDHHVYVGQAIYKLELTSKWRYSTNEITEQIKLNRTHDNIKGNVFFRAKSFKANAQSIQDTLQAGLYKHFALVPPMKWIDSIPPLPPESMKIKRKKEGQLIKWKKGDYVYSEDSATYYILYRFRENEAIELRNPENIVSIQRGNAFFDQSTEPGKTYKYVLTGVDRSHNESEGYLVSEVKTRD